MVDMVLRHAKMQIAFKGEFTGMREMRKHAAWYTGGYKHASRLRSLLNEVGDLRTAGGIIRNLCII